MFKLWIGNKYYTRGHLVNEVKRVLAHEGLDGYNNVELVGLYSMPNEVYEALPNDYEIIDYGSRETIAICLDNYGVISDDEIIRDWNSENLG